MLIDRTHKWWAVGAVIATLVSLAAFLVLNWGSFGQASGGSRSGLIFGILAAIAMVMAWLLAGKKSFPIKWRLGSSQTWLRIHIWFGLLSVPLVFFHTGFRWGGAFEFAFMVLFVVVILSGIHGLVVQQILPRLLKSRVPYETFPQQIPHLCRMFTAEADFLVSEKVGALPVDPEPLGEAVEQFAANAKKVRRGRPHAIYGKSGEKSEPAADKKAAAKSKPEVVAAAKRSAAPKPEPLTVKPVESPGVADSASPQEAAMPAKLSVAEQLKAAAAAKKAATGNPATTNSSAEALADSAPKMSVAEKIKAAAAAKKAAAGGAAAGGSTAEPPVAESLGDSAPKMSVAEKIKAAAAAKKTGAASEGAPGGEPAKEAKQPSKEEQLLKAKLAKAKVPAGSDVTGKPEQGTPAAVKSKPKPKGQAELENFEATVGLDFLKRFYLEEVRPFLSDDSKVSRKCSLADESKANQLFERGIVETSAGLHPTLVRLEELCEERREFFIQLRIQRWLHNWLYVHVPLSALLFVFLMIHVLFALRVVPWFG